MTLQSNYYIIARVIIKQSIQQDAGVDVGATYITPQRM